MKPISSGSFILGPLLLLGAISVSSAAIIDGGNSNLNNRFDTNRDGAVFAAEGFDLSGVGISTANGRWATLVSRNVAISAHHFRPDFDGSGFNNSVTFYPTNDQSPPFFTTSFTQSQRIGNTDLWIGVLQTPVPSDYHVYDFITEDIASAADYANSSLRYVPDAPQPGDQSVSVNAYTIGHNNLIDSTQWVGRNIIDNWYDDIQVNWGDGSSTVDDYLALGYNARAPSVTFESIAESKDSGSPLFITNESGELQLVGIAALRDPFEPQTGIQETLYSYVGNYDTEIQTYINQNAIPEPSSALLLFGGSLFFLANRRRKVEQSR